MSSPTVTSPSPRKKDFLLSVVVPCYNEEESIRETWQTLHSVLSGAGYKFECVFVDDGSRDATLPILTEIASENPNAKVVMFSRNFGQQVAIAAGMEYASGDAVVVIDADLQDPPEVIIEMVDKWKEGYDVAYAQRRKREGETWFKKITARIFYRLFNMISDVDLPLDTGDFRLMDRRVVDIIKQMPEKQRFLKGMVAWIGLKQFPVYYDRAPRHGGKSKYNILQLVRVAANGIFSFSNVPLKISMWLGFASAFLAFMGIIYTLYVRFFMDSWVSGWAFLSIIVFFFSGVQLLCLGLMGEYIGRIYQQDKGRPLYIIDRTLNTEK